MPAGPPSGGHGGGSALPGNFPKNPDDQLRPLQRRLRPAPHLVCQGLHNGQAQARVVAGAVLVRGEGEMCIRDSLKGLNLLYKKNKKG